MTTIQRNSISCRREKTLVLENVLQYQSVCAVLLLLLSSSSYYTLSLVQFSAVKNFFTHFSLFLPFPFLIFISQTEVRTQSSPHKRERETFIVDVLKIYVYLQLLARRMCKFYSEQFYAEQINTLWDKIAFYRRKKTHT